MKTIVLGGTGMVGKHLVKDLISDDQYSNITMVTRRELNEAEKQHFGLPNSKLTLEIVDFEQLDQYKNKFKGFDVAFCCLGTTRADAGSAEKFIKVDYDIPLKCASFIKEGSSKTKFLLVTAGGSNSNSFFLYPKTKGRLENSIKELGFNSTLIFRPGLLFFEGEQRPRNRFFEGVGISIASTLGIQDYVGISTSRLAKALQKAGISTNDKFKIFENSEILKE